MIIHIFETRGQHHFSPPDKPRVIDIHSRGYKSKQLATIAAIENARREGITITAVTGPSAHRPTARELGVRVQHTPGNKPGRASQIRQKALFAVYSETKEGRISFAEFKENIRSIFEQFPLQQSNKEP